MFAFVPKSALLNYLISIFTHLKWAFDFILYKSFFQARRSESFDRYIDSLGIAHYRMNSDSDETAECAVCLCKINEGDEVRELRCDHLFHRVCLDRWLGYGHVTCPLCRNNLKPPRFAAELHQEVIVVDFSAGGSRDGRETWWLR